MPKGIPKTPKEDLRQPFDREAPASVIADKFGGTTGMAKALNRSTSTVHRWRILGYIPPKYHAEINAAAKRDGVRVKPLDYMDTRKVVA